MCVNKRYIINPYTRKGLYVDCGHCPACQTEKAIRRVKRIQNTSEYGLECAMLTLTYSRGTAPYIDRSEAFNFSRGFLPYLGVYRDSSFRRVRVGSSYDFEVRRTDGKVKLTDVPFSISCDFDKTKDLKYERGKIGVCYYPDVQQFFARLRLNLNRNFNYNDVLKTYVCSEYGTKSLRPHFHCLLFYRKGNYETLRDACAQSWPFSDLSKFDRAFEKCYRGSSYVASYVNSGGRFPNFLSLYFRPKHSYSKGFGLGNRFFTLRSLLSMFDKGSFTYNVIDTSKVQSSVVSRLVPKYVIHRYFPLFKGYSRIAPPSLYDVIERLSKGDYDAANKLASPIFYSNDDAYKITIRLANAFKRCHDELPEVFPTFDVYRQYHINFWNLFHSNILRLQMENDNCFLFEKYDNLDEVQYKLARGDCSMPVGFSYRDFKILDPNKYPSNVSRTFKLTSDYNEHEKHRAVTNTVLSSLYEEF